MKPHLPPLLIHLVFHPESDDARELSREIHKALNSDSNIPGLRIPTVFCKENEGKPPEDQELDRAERSLVVPLADIDLNAEDDWCSFVAELWHTCAKENNNHRCIPVQLTEDAWPLDPSLSSVNFVRGYTFSGEERKNFIIRRLLIELCRYLDDAPLELNYPKAPITLFISHTKLDLNKKQNPVEDLQHYLTADQPIKTWFDSGDIPSGSAFEREIEKGIENTSLICVRTDNYSSREWCRKEVLLAKQKHRPMIVVNALTNQESRSFPYLGNLPEIRWNGDTEAILTLSMKESLRILHSQLLLESVKNENDILFPQAPELYTIANLPDGSNVLYPDPPLGQEELITLNARQCKFETPTERLATQRSLAKKRLAISVSECADISRFGLDELHYRDFIKDLNRYLLIKGATMVYGGHLAYEGFTQVLMNLVIAHNRQDNFAPFNRIENYVGWPVPFSKKDKVDAKQGAKLIRIPRPDGICEELEPEFKADPEYFSAELSPRHRYAWARGMTAMRQAQTQTCDARIVVGGTFSPTLKTLADGKQKESWYASQIPGVLEEIMTSLEAEQPVFVIGAFGGVAAMVVDILEGKDRPEMTWEFQKNAPYAQEMREIYNQKNEHYWDYDKMREFLLQKKIAGLNPGLTKDEHVELFHTTSIERMIELIIKGLDELEKMKK
jgi:hypothetical protein